MTVTRYAVVCLYRSEPRVVAVFDRFEDADADARYRQEHSYVMSGGKLPYGVILTHERGASDAAGLDGQLRALLADCREYITAAEPLLGSFEDWPADVVVPEFPGELLARIERALEGDGRG